MSEPVDGGSGSRGRNGDGIRFFGLDVHKYYIVACAVNASLPANTSSSTRCGWIS
jgi:hypothetical protein